MLRDVIGETYCIASNDVDIFSSKNLEFKNSTRKRGEKVEKFAIIFSDIISETY